LKRWKKSKRMIKRAVLDIACISAGVIIIAAIYAAPILVKGYKNYG
jgi:hypothetical protein